MAASVFLGMFRDLAVSLCDSGLNASSVKNTARTYTPASVRNAIERGIARTERPDAEERPISDKREFLHVPLRTGSRRTGARRTGPRRTGSRRTGSRRTGSRGTGPRGTGSRRTGSLPYRFRAGQVPRVQVRGQVRAGQVRAGLHCRFDAEFQTVRLKREQDSARESRLQFKLHGHSF